METPKETAEDGWRALTNSIIDTAVEELERDGSKVTSVTVAALLGGRLARIYDLHASAPAGMKAGDSCWCPECGEIGEYPDPCATSRLAVGDDQ